MAQRFTVTATTDASGDATVYAPPLAEPVVSGELQTIRYVKTDFATGVDFAITVEKTGEAVWTATNEDATVTKAPRQPIHTTTGTAETYDGTEAVNDKISIANDRIKIVVSDGGDTKTGTFHVVFA